MLPSHTHSPHLLTLTLTPCRTPIYICAFTGCNRLFPNRDRLMFHRKRDHESEDTSAIVTWNE
ncbi:hypothetical protein CONPUDRAFT_44783 [Coniophora puteana RWD-64-598 SS2]|uniref:C2H2-type domain-containing protein n=1 Tax=Coniophora puteana (strain RWD-64-598) TaxID=741705 RepID=A0A5M3N6J2_CONPW|nr:uncharacterized protein CONPUDRAFT_44783 [Coniophora puteana RWD-64-598 SS2]EIW86888.1 hypothetical protein CONPUDRAFT_44783 [Coniophora puteana RWD-64-598 SS2]